MLQGEHNRSDLRGYARMASTSSRRWDGLSQGNRNIEGEQDGQRLEHPRNVFWGIEPLDLGPHLLIQDQCVGRSISISSKLYGPRSSPH